MTDPLRGAWLRRQLPGVRVLVYARLGSTQGTALAGIEEGTLAPPALVAASRQTAGHGQRGNRWWSDGGTLCASFILPVVPGMPAGQVPLRAGLAVADYVAALLPGAPVEVKWPNDVYLHGRKVAGLLCARCGNGDVIGLGLNVNTHWRGAPAPLRSRATSLGTFLRPPPRRDEMLAGLWRALQGERTTPDWQPRYHRRHRLTHQWLQLHDDGTVYHGRCRGVDDQGRLVLETARGLQALTSGTVRAAEPAPGSGPR